MKKRTRPIVLFVSTLALVASLQHPPAHAQRSAPTSNVEISRSHFDRGVDYYRDGNTNAALIEFKRAYDASPNYRVLYNLGQVANALNDYVEAQRYFQRYLDEGGADITAERRSEVHSVVTKLAGRIAQITVECNADGAQIFVDDVAVGTSPLAKPLRVSAGTRRLSATISGRPRVTRVVEAVGGESLTVALELAPAAAPVETKPSVVYRESSGSSIPTATIWLGITTGALAVGTGVMGFLAAQDGSKFHDALDRSTTASEINRLHDRAATKALVTDILLGATAVSGAITLFVALQGSKAEADDASKERAHLSVGLGSVQLSGHLD